MRVATSWEEGIQWDHDNNTPIQIYTNGSGIDSMVGAAAVLYCRGRKVHCAKLQLGTTQEYTVTTAEGAAVILALHLLSREKGI